MEASFASVNVVPLNVNADPVAKADVLDAYTTPFAVNDDKLVPPDAVGSGFAKLTT
jgi:hypothetical protein